MDYYEALACKGKKVRYHDEEYVLLQVTKRMLNLAPGIPNPFMKGEFDGVIYHEGRRAARIVPVELLTAVPKELFRSRLVFGDVPSAGGENIVMEEVS